MSIITENVRIKQAPKSRYVIHGYFASPIDLYNSLLYAPALDAARAQFRDISFIEPRLKDWTNAEWLRDWVEIAPTLGLITILPRIDGSIGKGCYKEISDSITLGIPIYIFDHQQKEFFPFQKQIRFPLTKRTFQVYARVYFHTPETL